MYLFVWFTDLWSFLNLLKVVSPVMHNCLIGKCTKCNYTASYYNIAYGNISVHAFSFILYLISIKMSIWKQIGTLLFINTINHKVTILLAQVQKHPEKQFLGSKCHHSHVQRAESWDTSSQRTRQQQFRLHLPTTLKSVPPHATPKSTNFPETKIQTFLFQGLSYQFCITR